MAGNRQYQPFFKEVSACRLVNSKCVQYLISPKKKGNDLLISITGNVSGTLTVWRIHVKMSRVFFIGLIILR